MWENEIVQGSIIALISSFLTYVGWLKGRHKEQDAKIAVMLGRLDLLEQRHVTEPRVRELINEETADLRQGIEALNKDIKDLSGLIGNLRIDLGVLNYIKGIHTKND